MRHCRSCQAYSLSSKVDLLLFLFDNHLLSFAMVVGLNWRLWTEVGLRLSRWFWN